MKHETREEGNQTMMKRIPAYATIAVLLGLVMTMVPLALQNQQANQPEGRYSGALHPTSTAQTGSQNAFQSSSPAGLLTQPANLLPSSLILFSGLAVALGVYVILKKRTA